MMMLFSHGGVKIAMRSLYSAAKNDAELRKRRIAKILRWTRHEQVKNLRRLERKEGKLEKSMEMNFAVILFNIKIATEALYVFFVVALLRIKSCLARLRSIQFVGVLQEQRSTNAYFLALLSSLAAGWQAVPVSNCSDCRLNVVPFLDFLVFGMDQV